ncbi:MAG: endonuclease III [Planctomycetia bacterium]|nr:endonuclease III [Planctomycetia bacterium]
MVDEVKKRGREVLKILKKQYPEVHCTLEYRTPFQILIATILSAQCTDKRVNQVTADLFKKYTTPNDYLRVSLEELEDDIRSTGFYHHKAKNIRALCEILRARYHNEVPRTMEDLVQLPGVGRKTANVVLGNAFGISSGFVVDTHVGRLSRRLGLSEETDPKKVEQDLVRIFPQKEWIDASHRLIALGREYCSARKKRCSECPMIKICPQNE